jgi:hypothetical protein
MTPSRTFLGALRAMLDLATVTWFVRAFAGEARAAAVKVACIGEQTTHSDQFPATGVGEYPWMLQMRLGAAWDVQNFGDCCATVLQGYPKQAETHPYLTGKPYMTSLPFAPDIVVIGSWGKHDTEIANSLYVGVLDPVKFQSDYDTLVTTYLNLASHPKVYVSLPVPIPRGAPQGVTTNVILPAIQAVAQKYKLPIVDLYASFLNHPELYKDDTHVSNVDGLQKITDLVYAALTAGDDAGAPGTTDAASDVRATDDAQLGAGGGGSSGGGNSSGAGAGGSGMTGGGSVGGAAVGAGGTSGPGNAGASNADHGATALSAGCACSNVSLGRAPPWSWMAVLMTAALLRRRRARYQHDANTDSTNPPCAS